MTARLTRAAVALAAVLTPALALATAADPAHATGRTPAPSSSRTPTAHSTHTMAPGSAHTMAPGSARPTDPASAHTTGPASPDAPAPASSHTHTADPDSPHTTDPASAHSADRDPAVIAQLAAARAATAKYRFLPFATADGYDAHMCLARDQGGMGFHYFNESRFGSLDPQRPAGLLYEAGDDGGRKLVGVEWVVPVSDSEKARPRLFGQDFQGPMPGHYPGMPAHYDLHVWLYKNNPSGLFAQWNPTVKCPSS